MSGSTAISAFDLDKTLITVNSSYCFGKYLCRKGILSYRDLLYIISCSWRHDLGFLPIDSLHAGAFARLFRGKDRHEIFRHASEFVRLHMGKMLYPPAIERLRNAQDAGHITVLLSSGPDFLIEPFARLLNIPSWHSTEYAVDKDHRFCHISKLVLGSDKARILEEIRKGCGIANEQTYAYSDSHLDAAFLEAAGNPIGVNPTRRLRALCRQRNWQVI